MFFLIYLLSQCSLRISEVMFVGGCGCVGWDYLFLFIAAFNPANSLARSNKCTYSLDVPD